METIIYLIRHAEKLNKNLGEYKSKDNFQTRYEKYVLSVKGEHDAAALSKMDFLKDVNIIYSSNYVRAIQTAKYLSAELDLPINVDDDFGERKPGDRKNSNLPMFYYSQAHDFTYKAPGGESYNEVSFRMNKAIAKTVAENEGHNIAIFTHNHAMFSYLSKHCEVGYNLDDDIVLTYNENTIVSNLFNTPDVVKITYNDKEIVNIERIELSLEV